MTEDGAVARLDLSNGAVSPAAAPLEMHRATCSFGGSQVARLAVGPQGPGLFFW